MTKPQLFIGSSVESLPLARAVQVDLQYDFTVHVWTQGIFAPSTDTLGSLLRAARTADYALFVVAPDDVALIRDDVHGVARDNVLFELGMFFGALGRERSFMLRPIDVRGFHLPSDLDGVTALAYDSRDLKAGTTAVVGAACTAIREVAQRHRAHAPVLPGRWQQEWTLDTPEGKKSFPSVAEVRVLGNIMRATFPWEQRTIAVEGIVEGRHLTGTWRDSVTGPTYGGAFQLLISPTTNRMTGKWVGWSTGESTAAAAVQAGDWTWTKLEE